MLKNIFPTKIEVIENFLNKEEIDDLYSHVKKLSYIDHSVINGDGKSTFTPHDSNCLEGNKLEKKINNEIEKYCISIGIEKSTIDLCWANIQKKDSFLKMHHHHYSPVAGALYVKTDDKSSRLCFQNPNTYSLITNYVADPNPNVICYNVNPGDLFLFPGWLHHGSNYELNKSEERIVLSFNCK
tara:strand:+ start:404 stop:955 length:552 start_codon:yes stop_codon:yes gene_type:complete